jgi:hypothetical protein
MLKILQTRRDRWHGMSIGAFSSSTCAYRATIELFPIDESERC